MAGGSLLKSLFTKAALLWLECLSWRLLSVVKLYNPFEFLSGNKYKVK